MAPRNKIKENISRMAYDKPTMEKQIIGLRKSWNEVSKIVNGDKKKSKK